MQLTPAYVAGLIDGEGCLRLKRYKRGYTVQVRIGMTHYPILNKLCEQYGGSISLCASKSDLHKTVYCWELSGYAAEQLLLLIGSYLVVKQKQAIVLLTYGDPEMAYKEIAHLNRKGPDVDDSRV